MHLMLYSKDVKISPNHYLHCVSQQMRKVVSREANPLVPPTQKIIIKTKE